MIDINQVLNNLDEFLKDKEGIYIHRQKETTEYFEAEEDVMGEMIDFAKTKGWMNAVKKFLKDNPRLPAEYLFDLNRADFLYALPTLGNRRFALDIGSGMGGILTHLSSIFENVFANESSYKRLLFSKVKLGQEDKNNIFYLNSDFKNVRFKEDCFDLAVVNGVLEWIPFSYGEEVKPTDAQKMFLLEIYRILKKGGVLYIGIENRFSKEAIMGREDPHTGIRFNSVVPRWIADYMVKLRFRALKKNRYFRLKEQVKKYRNYTYSYLGYKHMLASAGFSKVFIDIPVPNYNRPYNIFSSDNRILKENVQYFTKNAFLKMLYNIFPSIIKYMAHSYAIFAVK